MKNIQFGDAASDYFKTRVPDEEGINKEFSDVIKTMGTGLKKYVTTL
jgi:hypothetical protein